MLFSEIINRPALFDALKSNPICPYVKWDTLIPFNYINWRMDNQLQKKLMEENAGLKKQLADQSIELERRNRELEIEAALENVRLRAGAMRFSSELGEASEVLFQQLNELGIQAIRTAVCIFDDPNEAMELWLTSYAESGEMVRMLYYFNLHIHPVFENIIPARRENKSYALTILSGNEVRSYYQTMSTYLSVPRQLVFNETEYFYFFFFSGGTINAVTNQPLTGEQCKIMIRCCAGIRINLHPLP